MWLLAYNMLSRFQLCFKLQLATLHPGGHDVTLVYFLHDAAAADRHKRVWETDARAAGVTDLQLVPMTRHYYLPMHLAHAFEAGAHTRSR